MLRFGHLASEDDCEDYQGHEIQWLGFDELTHFTERQYRSLIGRVRSPRPYLPRRVRATSNPGGVGHEWVFQRWGPWLDPSCDWSGLPPRVDPETEEPIPPAKSGQVLWVRQTVDGEDYVPAGTEGAHSRTFIASRLQDNPSLMENDPNYGQRLLDNDPVRARQLALGDWLVRYAAGLMFKRAMFRFLDQAPKRWIHRVRFWDRAATPQKIKAGKPTGDPDWTIGVRYLMLPDFTFCVDDVVRLREGPGDVWNTIRNTAKMDGRGTVIGLEQEPGASGKSEAAAYVNALPGFAVWPIPASGSKIVRAGPVSATASAGNVALVRAPWNEPFLRCLENFPSGKHDDDTDAFSGAHNLVTSLPLPEQRDWDNLPVA
jgi:predicted phage terminase large subunit-like protein